MNRIQEARPEAELAVRLNGFTHKEVLETLKDLNRRTESSGSRVLEKGTRLSSPSH